MLDRARRPDRRPRDLRGGAARRPRRDHRARGRLGGHALLQLQPGRRARAVLLLRRPPGLGRRHRSRSETGAAGVAGDYHRSQQPRLRRAAHADHRQRANAPTRQHAIGSAGRERALRGQPPRCSWLPLPHRQTRLPNAASSTRHFALRAMVATWSPAAPPSTCANFPRKTPRFFAIPCGWQGHGHAGVEGPTLHRRHPDPLDLRQERRQRQPRSFRAGRWPACRSCTACAAHR